MANIIGNCSACGQIIKAENSKCNYFLCACGSMYFKNGQGDLQTSTSHSINHFIEPIQVGTEGVWNAHKFVVLGRFRLWFAESTFNYWSILFNDGTLKLLAEGYGLYAIYELFDSDSPLSVHTLDGFVFDTSILISGLDKYFI